MPGQDGELLPGGEWLSQRIGTINQALLASAVEAFLDVHHDFDQGLRKVSCVPPRGPAHDLSGAPVALNAQGRVRAVVFPGLRPLAIVVQSSGAGPQTVSVIAPDRRRDVTAQSLAAAAAARGPERLLQLFKLPGGHGTDSYREVRANGEEVSDWVWSVPMLMAHAKDKGRADWLCSRMRARLASSASAGEDRDWLLRLLNRDNGWPGAAVRHGLGMAQRARLEQFARKVVPDLVSWISRCEAGQHLSAETAISVSNGEGDRVQLWLDAGFRPVLAVRDSNHLFALKTGRSAPDAAGEQRPELSVFRTRPQHPEEAPIWVTDVALEHLPLVKFAFEPGRASVVGVIPAQRSSLDAWQSLESSVATLREAFAKPEVVSDSTEPSI